MSRLFDKMIRNRASGPGWECSPGNRGVCAARASLPAPGCAAGVSWSGHTCTWLGDRCIDNAKGSLRVLDLDNAKGSLKLPALDNSTSLLICGSPDSAPSGVREFMRVNVHMPMFVELHFVSFYHTYRVPPQVGGIGRTCLLLALARARQNSSTRPSCGA